MVFTFFKYIFCVITVCVTFYIIYILGTLIDEKVFSFLTIFVIEALSFFG